MKQQLQIGSLYGTETKNEIYIYLGNNTIYCCRSPFQNHIGRCYKDGNCEVWLQKNFHRLG